MSLPVVILAGGLGTRLGEVTKNIPKSLIPIHGVPFLAHQIRLLKSQNISQILLCAGHLGDKIQEAFEGGHHYGIQIQYSFDGPKRLGTAGALRRAVSMLAEDFFVMYGDSYLPTDMQAVEQAYLTCKKPALMTIYENQGQWDRSNVWFEKGMIRRYNKARPTGEMTFIDYGLSVLSRSMIENLPDGESLDLADLFQAWSEKGQLAGFQVFERFYEIGSQAGIVDFENYLLTTKNFPAEA